MLPIKETISESQKLKRISDTIQIGNDWYQQKMKDGWEETEFGLMSPDEIKESGMVKDFGGLWTIPTVEYISEKREIGRNKGEKYYGIAPKFLLWYKKLTNKLTVDDHINYEIEKEKRNAKTKPDDFEEQEFSIDDIPF